MTTGAAGLDPAAVIFGDLPARDRVSDAVVILGGLVTSTLLNLFILPAFICVSAAHGRADGQSDRSGSVRA